MAISLTKPLYLAILASMNYIDSVSVPFLQPLGVYAIPLLVIVIVWSLVIKGIALWRSARKGHKVWFIVLLLLNDLGVLELVYLTWFSHEKHAVLDIAPEPSIEE